MNKCVITSNSSNGREYEVKTTSAMKCAAEYGRAEGGEIVTVYSPTGKPLSEVRWSPEDGGHYYRVSK